MLLLFLILPIFMYIVLNVPMFIKCVLIELRNVKDESNVNLPLPKWRVLKRGRQLKKIALVATGVEGRVDGLGIRT